MEQTEDSLTRGEAMRTKSVKVLMAALVVLAVSFGCSSSDGGVQTPTNPGTPTPTVSTAGLSAAAVAQINDPYSTFRETIRRWADRNTPVRVYGGPYDVAVVQAAADRWSTAGAPIQFLAVSSESIAELVVANENPLVEGGCASTDLSGSPAFLGGKIRIGIGVKPGCDGGLNLALTHNFGHAMGLGHGGGVMEERVSSFDILPHHIEVLNWSYKAPVGAEVR